MLPNRSVDKYYLFPRITYALFPILLKVDKMRKTLLTPVLLVYVLLALGVSSQWIQAQQSLEDSVPQRRLVVGTKIAPPFAIKNNNGTWGGISIDLWRQIAKELQYSYTIREYDLQGLLQAVEKGEVDIAVAALTVTSEREERMDFSHSIHSTGLSIAVRPGQKRGWLGVIRRIVSTNFLKVVGGLILVLIVIGLLVWLFERRKNRDQFGGGTAKGIGAGFWWSAVTMTTVGYGDKTPKTVGGRVIALIWMFTALIIIAGFTGAIASSLTVGELEEAVRGPADLVQVTTGSVSNSTSDTYLRKQHIQFRGYATPHQGMQALANGDIDAFVYDAPILRYIATVELQGKVKVLPSTFERQDYAFALPSTSILREPINRILLKKIADSQWQETLYQYLGRR
jgi:polar amino acid transport system substrate-binding protein